MRLTGFEVGAGRIEIGKGRLTFDRLEVHQATGKPVAFYCDKHGVLRVNHQGALGVGRCLPSPRPGRQTAIRPRTADVFAAIRARLAELRRDASEPLPADESPGR